MPKIILQKVSKMVEPKWLQICVTIIIFGLSNWILTFSLFTFCDSIILTNFPTFDNTLFFPVHVLSYLFCGLISWTFWSLLRRILFGNSKIEQKRIVSFAIILLVIVGWNLFDSHSYYFDSLNKTNQMVVTDQRFNTTLLTITNQEAINEVIAGITKFDTGWHNSFEVVPTSGQFCLRFYRDNVEVGLLSVDNNLLSNCAGSQDYRNISTDDSKRLKKSLGF